MLSVLGHVVSRRGGAGEGEVRPTAVGVAACLVYAAGGARAAAMPFDLYAKP
jgi:hypothetical protein